MPPHCGNIGPWCPSPLPGDDDVVAPGLLSPESEHPAIVEIRIMADTARPSTVGLRRTTTLLSLRPLLVHTMHCSGSPTGQPPTRHLIRHFHAFAGCPRSTQPCRGAHGQFSRRCATVTPCSWHCCASTSGPTAGYSRC